jgi:hypothetical protein
LCASCAGSRSRMQTLLSSAKLEHILYQSVDLEILK